MAILEKLFGPPNIEKLKERQDIDGLIKALHHEHVSVRCNAVRALGELKDHRSVDTLITALRDDKAEYVRKLAAESLGELNDSRTIEPLVAALEDKHWWVREAAAKALGQIGDATAVEPLVAALMDEAHAVRWRAAQALGKRGDARVVEVLIGELNAAAWGEAAAKALADIGAAAVGPLVAALEDKDHLVRERVAKALGWEPVNDVQRALQAIALQDWQEAVSLGAAAVEPLVTALKSGSFTLAEGAERALGQIGDAGAVGALVEAIRDEYIQRMELADEYQAEIDRTGGWTPIGGSDSIRCRRAQIESANVATRAAHILSNIGASAVDPIVASLKQTARSKDWHVRSVRGHDDLDWQVRDALGGILGEVLRAIADPHAGDLLIVALKDRDQNVRYTAAKALGKFGDPRAVDSLTVALRDESEDVRLFAAEALGEIKDSRAVQALMAALEDREEGVRLVSKHALERIGGPEAERALAEHRARQK